MSAAKPPTRLPFPVLLDQKGWGEEKEIKESEFFFLSLSFFFFFSLLPRIKNLETNPVLLPRSDSSSAAVILQL